MSIQAELIRLGLRWLLRPRLGAEDTVAKMRRQTEGFTRWTPPPPPGTATTAASLRGVPAQMITRPGSLLGRHVLFLHGGGYATGSPALYRHITWRLADATAARITAIDYRLAPEHPFPAAVVDASSAWQGLLDAGAEPGRIAIIGDSAGGGLALALALRLRDRGEALPGAIVAICPWTDLTLAGASWRTSPFGKRHVLKDVQALAAAYLGNADAHNPYASPLYADPAGLPPTLIQVGSDEALLDDAVRMAERMQAAKCDVILEVWPRMPHVWHAFASIMPEAQRAIARIGDFVGGKLPA